MLSWYYEYMRKEIPKVPREKRKGTYLYTASRLEAKVRKAGLKTAKKAPKK